MMHCARRLTILRNCPGLHSQRRGWVLQYSNPETEKLFSTLGARQDTPPRAPSTTSLVKQLKARIMASGPITVSSYMKEVLTNPLGGYYMHKDVFGTSGDFITSPEISPLFGEMVAVWFLTEWKKIGSPHPLQLIELGPGRGTLIRDVLKIFGKFGALEGVSVHLVEISPHMSDLQAGSLGVAETNVDTRKLHYRCGLTDQGLPIYWYTHAQDVPAGFSLVLAHEFLDALPVHKLQKTEEGWREVLIDVDTERGGDKFRYVISRSATPASRLFVSPGEGRSHVEVSPETSVLLQGLATRLERDGGFALVADYGHDGTKTDTFRAFRRHALHDPLVDPGTADLTADVDFSAVRDAVRDKLVTFGPVAQAEFLRAMGIDVRLDALLAGCTDDEEGGKRGEALRSGHRMITDPDGMGGRFHFFSMFPAVLKEHLERFPVAGFPPPVKHDE